MYLTPLSIVIIIIITIIIIILILTPILKYVPLELVAVMFALMHEHSMLYESTLTSTLCHAHFYLWPYPWL